MIFVPHPTLYSQLLLGDPRSAREWNDPEVTNCNFTQHSVRLLPYESAYLADSIPGMAA